MKVVCRHGFFEFYPQTETDLKRFERILKVTLEPVRNFFTFEALVDLPRYSLQGSLYKNLPALVTYEGRDEAEVFRENEFVYHFETELLIPKTLVLSTITLPATQDSILAPSCFVQPGSVLKNGSRIDSYQGMIDFDVQRLRILSLEFSL